MDPNNNLTPGAVPTPTPTPAPAPDPLAPEPPVAPVAPAPISEPAPVAPEPQIPETAVPDLEAQLNSLNPATDVANAAMNGAEPIVVATPEEPEGPVNLAPSADFSMPEVQTVSAMPNGADPNLSMAADPMATDPMNQPLTEVGAPAAPAPVATEPTVGQPLETPSNPSQIPTGENPENPENPNEQIQNPEDMEPIVAAAPVPGSIGSAKSYADIQREEAEKAAKVAANQGKKFKLTKNTILIIIIAVVALIGVIVGAIMIFGGNSSTPTPTVTQTTSYPEEPVTSSLSCKRTLAVDEYVSFGAVNGTWENVFYFADDELDGLVTNINYNYPDAITAKQWQTFFEAQYGPAITESDKEDEEKEEEETEEPDTNSNTNSQTSGEKTPADMLHHYVIVKDLTVTHKMEVKSEDIEDWLASDAYSDVTYGAETNADETTERNLDYYKGLQNAINYTCTVSK